MPPLRDEVLQSVIDWGLEEKPFRDSIQALIQKCKDLGKVVPLPMGTKWARGQDLLILLLAQVDCRGCPSWCCRIPAPEPIINVLPQEYAVLAPKYGAEKFRMTTDGPILPMPCPFLKSGLEALLSCNIYPERPLVCFFYPFQSGARDQEGDLLAVASSCPEGCRIALQVFMAAWRLRRLAERAGLE